MNGSKGDLIVLVPDLDTEELFGKLLQRSQALGIRDIDLKILRHNGRDPGCLLESHTYLRAFHNQFQYCLVAFDREGCGMDAEPREKLEAQVEKELERNGWPGRALAIVFDPEVEIWVWSGSHHVLTALGFSAMSELKLFLDAENYALDPRSKPVRPKEAMRAALKKNRVQPSAAIFARLAEVVSLKNCRDPAFEKLRQSLGKWFPA